jgi:hypothetical protein
VPGFPDLLLKFGDPALSFIKPSDFCLYLVWQVGKLAQHASNRF